MNIPVIRILLLAALLAPASTFGQSATPTSIPTKHSEATVAQLQAEMASGSLTSEQLTQEYINRILALDQNGPGVNSVIELNPDALVMARNADALRRRGVVLGPLHGIPVLLKDNIDTGDKMQTSAGSLALVGTPALRDSTVATNLRAGGAVILGKTNLSEWANFRSFESISGWSGRAGVVPISHTQDTVGPDGRTVADAAAALSVIESRTFDGRDPATGGVPLGWQGTGKTRPTNIPTDYTKFVNPHGLQGAKLGVTRVGLGGFDPNVPTPQPVLDAFEEAVQALQNAGATVIDLDAAGFNFASADGEFLVLLFEFRNDVAAYFGTRVGVPVAGGT